MFWFISGVGFVSNARVEAGLCRRTGAEEVGVHRSEIPIRIDDDEAENSEGDDPRV